MRDYWLTKDLLQATGIAFIVLSLIGIALALWLPKKWWGKLLAVIAVAFVISLPLREARKEEQQQQVVVDDYKERYAKAKALFDKRCETAGENIYKTVENVEGIQLLKVRQYESGEGQFESGAAAHEGYGDDYIHAFLLFERDDAKFPGRNLAQDLSTTTLPGYRFVDVVDATDQKRYRYTLTPERRLKREETSAPAPRYGVTFDDINIPSEREYWVAGSTVKVIDLTTKATLGEFKRYVIEPGQGSRAGQRTPWLFAVGCNMKSGYGSFSTRLFTDQVLKPSKGLSK